MSEQLTTGRRGRRSLGGRLMGAIDRTPTQRWAAAVVALVLGATLFWGGTVGRAPTADQRFHLGCTLGLGPSSTDVLQLRWGQVAAPAGCDVSRTLHDRALGAIADATEVVTGHRVLDLRVLALLGVVLLVVAVSALVARLPGPGWVRTVTGLGVGVAVADSGVVGARLVSLDPSPLAVTGLLLVVSGWLTLRRRVGSGRGSAVALLVAGLLALAVVMPPVRLGGGGAAGLADRHRQFSASVLEPLTVLDGVPTDGGPAECRLCVANSVGNTLGGAAGVILPLLWFACARCGVQLVRRSRQAKDRDGRTVGEALVLLVAVASVGHVLAITQISPASRVQPLVVASTVLLLPIVVTAGWHLVRVGALTESRPGLLRRAGRVAAAWLVVPVPTTRPIPPPLVARAPMTPPRALAGPFRRDTSPSERERTPWHGFDPTDP